MIQKLFLIGQLLRNMGLRYTLFRLQYEAKRVFLPVKLYAPTYSKLEQKTQYKNWLKHNSVKLFVTRGTFSIERNKSELIRTHYENIQNGGLCFFRNDWKQINPQNPWHQNPDSGFVYNNKTHWSKIADYSTTQGDIKYVWERARFTHLLDIIRHDYHFHENHAKEVFDEIKDWILNNPSELGPHYRCSQEISLRLIHWLMALNYYEADENITDEFWDKFEESVYAQFMHVYHNIQFSRIAVRNNHALTESLLLYITASLFPHFPNAAKIKAQGKRFFEEEIAYQIYPDGTYLQYSNNYHRVVIQLLTLAISFAERQQEKWSDTVYNRAALSLEFLNSQCEASTGELPNYGSNDGALFFPLSNTAYRDFRPALNALHQALYKEPLFSVKEVQEEASWLCNFNNQAILPKREFKRSGLKLFTSLQGGYAMYRDEESFTFLNACAYKDRPAQADNLHLDIWYKGENILRDNGSYKYNASKEDIRYFMGTASHNTVQLGSHDQMLKGGRFIWYYWSKKAVLNTEEENDFICLKGTVNVYRQLKKGIHHTRKVTKWKTKTEWLVEDFFNDTCNLAMHQRWHVSPDGINNLEITAVDANDKVLTPQIEDCFYSQHYGQKEPSKCIIFTSETNKIITRITLK